MGAAPNRMDFRALNDAWCARWRALGDDSIRPGYRAAREEFARLDGGPSLTLHAVPMMFPRADFDDIADAGATILAAQRRLLREVFLPRGSRAVLETFAIPAPLEPLMDFERLHDDVTAPARFDVLPTDDGFRFCEVNVDSAICGPEFVPLGRALVERLTAAGCALAADRVCPDPVDDLASLVRAAAARRPGATDGRLVVLDWRGTRESATVSSLTVVRALAARLPAMAVERAWDDDWSAPDPAHGAHAGEGDHLILRMILGEDALADRRLLAQLERRRGDLVVAFESDILSSKLWWAVLHDPAFRPHLSATEQDAVRRYIPHTFALAPDRLDEALAHKDDLVFKQVASFGGRDVLLGDAHDRAELRARITAAGAHTFIAQERVPTPPVACLRGPDEELVRHPVVLGLFVIGGRPSGLFVRSHAEAGVINMARQAACGWSLVVDDAEWSSLAACLERPSHP